jgi:hypothetical protein
MHNDYHAAMQILNELTPDDTGVWELEGSILHFEGFTEWCQEDALARCNLPDSDPRKLSAYEDVYAEVLQGWKALRGAAPIHQGFAGTDTHPIQWALFNK